MIAAVIANTRKPGAGDVLRRLRAALRDHDCEFMPDAATAALLGDAPDGAPHDGHDPAAFPGRADVAIVLGGDGTMLHAIDRLGGFDGPVAGINIGTLGFLTTCTDRDIPEFAAALADGRVTTSPRTLLEATVHRVGKPTESFTALNEITLARGETGRLVSLRVAVDGEHLNDYRADGLIVATPTGSTAYSLSAGGPLITPGAGVFLITPICPHSLGQRSLVLGDDSVIRLAPYAAGGDAPPPLLFTADGRDTTRLAPGDWIEVRKSHRTLRLLRLADHSFYEALRLKLHWQGLG